jgi:hypothetical protein
VTDEDEGEAEQLRLSDELEAWLHSDRHKTVGDLVDTFGPGSFAILFVVLMAFPALPVPTGGISHVLEAVAMLLALELVLGRQEVWIPARWQGRELRGVTGERFSALLLKRIRWFERFARPRWSHLFDFRVTSIAFGTAVLGLALTAFMAPPFSGLDTLPSLGVVVMSLGVLLRDAAVAVAGAAIGLVGVVLVIGLGRAVLELF